MPPLVYYYFVCVGVPLVGEVGLAAMGSSLSSPSSQLCVVGVSGGAALAGGAVCAAVALVVSLRRRLLALRPADLLVCIFFRQEEPAAVRPLNFGVPLAAPAAPSGVVFAPLP